MRRGGAAASVVAAVLLLDASPTAAHGVGGRVDLPLPFWLFVYGAAGAVLASFIALRTLWPRPRLAAAAVGRQSPTMNGRLAAGGRVLGRVVGLAAFVLVAAAAVFGTNDAALNIAPVAVFVVFWVGLQMLSAVFGNVWSVLSPFETAAALASRISRTPTPDSPPAENSPEFGLVGTWSAPVLLLTFLWLELAYHDPSSPAAIGLWLIVYSAAVFVGLAVWGRGWLRHGEGFAALFGLLSEISPLFRDELGRLRLRAPFSGLSLLKMTPPLAAVTVVALGSTTFDGFSRTTFWQQLLGTRTGWSYTTINTLGLIWMIALVAVAFQIAARAAGRIGSRSPGEMVLGFASSLVPIVLAYTVAHYFSLLVFESQGAWAALSDPFGRGWDVFGSANNSINYGAVSATTIAIVQAGAIVVGHIAGVVVAHDRSVELWSRRLAERTQYPMLAVMIAYTVGGLAILLGG